MLTLAGVSAYYGKTQILRSIDVELGQGQCLCVLGRNGVGKTTLLRTIMGLVTRMTGRLLVDEQDISASPTHLRALAGLGYVPQGRRILGKFTVRENLILGTFARPNGARGIPDHCLELFPALAERLDRRAGLLSGGQQQQLAIARALATEPKILLLDEPMEGIQPNVVLEIEAALRRLNRELGMTLVLTEQHISSARALSDQYLIMDVGRVVRAGLSSNLTDEIVQAHLAI